MNHALDTPMLGPGAQAVRLAFWFVVAIALFAGVGWASSGIRRIPADSRAVVMSFGAFVRTQDAGLLLAWPRPFEAVSIIPGDARVLELRISSLDRDRRAQAADPTAATDSGGAAFSTSDNVGSWGLQPDGAAIEDTGPLLPDALAGSGYALTGDNGVVQLSATLYYRVVDPYAYLLQEERLDSALQRIVAASAVEVTAERDLDSILVARPEWLSTDQRTAVRREQLRGDVADAVRRHLKVLDADHGALGIEVSRVDIQAQLPANAVDAFNLVLTSLQTANRNIAEARTQAENARQRGQQSADRVVHSAQASATERVATAQAETSTILQLESSLDTHDDPGLLARAYRERIQSILSKAGRVTTIDSRGSSNLLLPGKIQ
jgi:regulator of protease activity HflC (stomatin/prohibitin superfamily)